MKTTVNGITYNSETGKIIKEWDFKDGGGGRTLMQGIRGKAKGKYYVVTWKHPYYTPIGIMPISENDLDNWL